MCVSWYPDTVVIVVSCVCVSWDCGQPGPPSALTGSLLLLFFLSGGTQYDQSHIILNTVNQEKTTQVWEAMVL